MYLPLFQVTVCKLSKRHISCLSYLNSAAPTPSCISQPNRAERSSGGGGRSPKCIESTQSAGIAVFPAVASIRLASHTLNCLGDTLHLVHPPDYHYQPGNLTFEN